MADILGAAPWAILSGAGSWIIQGWLHREKRKADRAEHSDRLEIHRDELAMELVQNARTEIGAARAEVEELRGEVTTLRALEKHFYHFQQSLDHLEAVLFSSTSEERTNAERSAKAFLTRMRRLNDAKGTIRNEIQRADSITELATRGIITPEPEND